MKLHDRLVAEEFWVDSTLLRKPMEKRMVFIGLLACSEDSGCFKYDPFEIKMSCFPSPLDSSITPEFIEECINEFVADEILVKYSKNNVDCLFFRNFKRHQKMRKSPPTKIPLPDWVKYIPYDTNKNIGKYVDDEEALESFLNNDVPQEKTQDKISVAQGVSLKKSEIESLESRFGKDFTELCIAKLSDYKMAKGKKYKSDYHAIMMWVVRAVNEDIERSKKGGKPARQFDTKGIVAEL